MGYVAWIGREWHGSGGVGKPGFELGYSALMSDYNPFGKIIREIDTGDLSTLRDVSEGWYVEYKSEVPDAPSIAKSISALANTYGGWIFYGIDETDSSEKKGRQFYWYS